MKVTLICDGGCLNNQDENNRIAYGSWRIEGYLDGGTYNFSHRDRVFFGNQTNNAAEYLALINGLKEIKEIHGKRIGSGLGPFKLIEIWTDSQLVVNQVNRKWKINDRYLEKLVGNVHDLFQYFESSTLPVTIMHRPREVIVEVLGH